MWLLSHNIQGLLGAVLLLSCVSVHAQVAPGDEDPRCLTDLNNAVPGAIILMDSRHYENLLEEYGAVWDQMDFDTNNPPGDVNPTYVSLTLQNFFLIYSIPFFNA